jgi:hypothetical protein
MLEVPLQAHNRPQCIVLSFWKFDCFVVKTRGYEA